MKAKREENSFQIKKNLKRFWHYIWYDDSLGSYVMNFIVALIFIKFIFFPGLGLLLGTNIPVVAVVSGSMEHKIVDGRVCDKSFDESYDTSLSLSSWWDYCGNYYENNYNISKEEFSQFDFKNGLNTGDVIILTGKDTKDIELGEVLVFIPGDRQWYSQNGPVIHRVIDKKQINGEYYFTTKGDHNPSVSQGNFEKNITEDQVLAVAQLKIPYIGYLKVWLSRLLGVF